jgi:hypothetical protein
MDTTLLDERSLARRDQVFQFWPQSIFKDLGDDFREIVCKIDRPIVRDPLRAAFFFAPEQCILDLEDEDFVD